MQFKVQKWSLIEKKTTTQEKKRKGTHAHYWKTADQDV